MFKVLKQDSQGTGCWSLSIYFQKFYLTSYTTVAAYRLFEKLHIVQRDFHYTRLYVVLWSGWTCNQYISHSGLVNHPTQCHLIGLSICLSEDKASWPRCFSECSLVIEAIHISKGMNDSRVKPGNIFKKMLCTLGNSRYNLFKYVLHLELQAWQTQTKWNHG